jgi:hypothetical protein
MSPSICDRAASAPGRDGSRDPGFPASGSSVACGPRGPRAGLSTTTRTQAAPESIDTPGTEQQSSSTSIKAHPAKAGAAKPRLLPDACSPTPPDATKDTKTAELPRLGWLRLCWLTLYRLPSLRTGQRRRRDTMSALSDSVEHFRVLRAHGGRGSNLQTEVLQE